MSDQAIQSQDITISDLFQAFYAVPDYQREYVWETEQVEQLLNDISAELSGNIAADAPEYFIGSVVVCPGKDNVLELIDGQQRMTTLFLTLCAIRDRFIEMGKNPPGALNLQIAATSIDAAGEDHFRYRLDLQYEDSGDILRQLAEGLVNGNQQRDTRSIRNITNAHRVATEFLRREYAEDEKALRSFYGYLINKVKVIRIQTKDVAKALKVFETINDRGVGLDSMDLLKNLLFMKAGRDEFEKLKSIWKELQDSIYSIGEKPLRFLRYYIFSRYDVEVLREDEIYGWFAKNPSLCGYAKNPLGFAKEVLQASKAYGHFLRGFDQNGVKNRYLENLQLLGGKAARQHLILLLAGRHLDAQLFDRLAQEVEDLLFVYVITREHTRDFEKNFVRWSMDLRAVSNEAGLKTFIADRFTPTKSDLAPRFDDALRRLDTNSVQQYRLRYILAKLTQHIDLAAYGETEGTKWLSRYAGAGFEIEHIFPQQPSIESALEFGQCDDPSISKRLGNLVLVEKPINASLGNQAYSKKRPVYLQSQLLLTKALTELPKVGLKTTIDLAVKNLTPFLQWNSTSVVQRQEQLATLARAVWQLP